MSSRREKIEAMLKLEPEDHFLRYGLATELDNEGQFEESLVIFRGLMKDKPPHVASFLRGAQLLVKMDEIAEARAVLREGVEIARASGEMHAAGEMAELLAGLGALGE
jgi:hypothetical protein